MRSINFFLTLFFVASSCTITFAADKYVVAKIVLSNNDTIVNLVKFTQLHELQKKLEVKVTDEISKTLYPLDVKSFYTIAGKGDTVRFESRCGVKFGIADNADDNCYFMMRVNSAPIPLYYFSETKLLSMGTSMKNVQQPIYLTNFRERWYTFDESNYLNQLQRFFKQFKYNNSVDKIERAEELSVEISMRKYAFTDIPKIFERLNNLLK